MLAVGGRGNAIAAMENLDRTRRDARPELLAQQLVRHRVVVFGDLDVVVEPDPAFLPFDKDVGLNRQRFERRPLQILEQRPAARTEMALRAIVDLGDQLGDGGVQCEKNCRLRSFAMMKRVATCTATSTLALSRGFLGQIGRAHV